MKIMLEIDTEKSNDIAGAYNILDSLGDADTVIDDDKSTDLDELDNDEEEESIKNIDTDNGSM